MEVEERGECKNKLLLTCAELSMQEIQQNITDYYRAALASPLKTLFGPSCTKTFDKCVHLDSSILNR